MTNELDLAASISRGDVAGPQPYGNGWLVNMRISGSGTAWRPGLNEFANRDPARWLSESMLRRWLGAPVIIGHPPGDLLTAESYRASVVGSIIYTSVRGSDLYGIARIFDADVVKAITASDSNFSDTSPSVTFAPDQMSTITLADGSVLRVEGTPDLIDHLAICNLGVWSKGGPANGVDKAEGEQ
jgi:hypothetical protein